MEIRRLSCNLLECVHSHPDSGGNYITRSDVFSRKNSNPGKDEYAVPHSFLHYRSTRSDSYPYASVSDPIAPTDGHDATHSSAFSHSFKFSRRHPDP